MKALILISLLASGYWSCAQDTIVFKSGKVEAVQILSLKKESNLIVYISSNDTIYSNLLNFEEVILHAELDDTMQSDALQVDAPVDPYAFTPLKNRPFKFSYGKWSLGSNLFSLIPATWINARISLVPEYQLSNHFSVTLPVEYGISSTIADSDYYPKNEWNYDQKYIEILLPAFDTPATRFNGDNIIAQTGAHLKYYPYQKSKRTASFYLTAGADFGISKVRQFDWYIDMDTLSYTKYDLGPFAPYEYTYWSYKVNHIVNNESDFFYTRFDFALGIEFNIARSWIIGSQFGVETGPIGIPVINDKYYVKTFDSDYILTEESPARYRNERIPLKMKLNIIYRFGGKRI